MEGMPARLSCYYQSDLSTLTHWVKAKGAVDEDFDKSDPKNFEALRDAKGNHLVTNVLDFKETHVNDSGLYICVGQNNMKRSKPEFMELKVLSQEQV